MMMNEKFIILFFIHIFSLILFLFVDSIQYLKIILSLQLFFGILVYKILFKKVLSLSTLFIASFTFFILARILVDLFVGINFAETISFTFYKFSPVVQREMLSILFIHIWSIFLGFFIFRFINTPKKLIVFNFSKGIFKFSTYLFYITLPIAIYSTYVKLFLVLNDGYLSLFKDNKNTEGLIVLICNMVFTFSFYLIISSRPPIGKLKVYAIFYYLTLLLTLLTGQRGFALCQIVIVSYAIISLYNIKVNFFRIFIFFVGIMFLAIFIEANRSNSDFILNSDIFVLFIYGQGISLQVLGYSIEYQNILNYNFLNLFAEFRSVAESIYYRLIGEKSIITRSAYLSMKEFGHLGLKLSYTLNRDKFFLGQGIGSSYLAELYLVGGKSLVLIGGVLLGYIIEFLNFKMLKNRKYLLLILMFGSSLIFLPRDSLFAFFSTNIIVILLYILLKVLFPKIHKKLL